jgi:hypothetical protein
MQLTNMSTKGACVEHLNIRTGNSGPERQPRSFVRTQSAPHNLAVPNFMVSGVFRLYWEVVEVVRIYL